MSTFSLSEQRELSDGYLFSNTVGSLYRWLEQHSAVLRVAEFSNEDGILDEIAALQREAIRSAEVLAVCYAYLVALVLIRRKLGKGLGECPVPSGSLRWAAEMWPLAREKEIATAQVSVAMAPRSPVVSTPERVTLNTSGILIDLSGNPIVRG